MKKMIGFVLLINMFVVASLEAGGSHYEAEILTLETKGNDEFVMVVKQYSDPYNSAKHFQPRTLIIHLRHNSKLADKEDYLKSINGLIKQFKAGGKFYFGVMGKGYVLLDKQNNEYQSNGLKELKEYDGRKVICSFAN